MFQHIGILVAAILGFLLSVYIWHKERRGEQLVCMIGEDCSSVMHSRYARLFGFRIEILGLAYYGFMALFYGYVLLATPTLSPAIEFVVKIITIFATLFSLRLLVIQAFVLKQWCMWCLASAGISIAIAVLSFV